MAIDFSKFEQLIDEEQLAEDVKNAPDTDFDKVPDGNYIVSIEAMEIKETKAKDKLMFTAQCKIKEGEQKGRMIFFNRVIFGNKSTEKWNDGKAIKSVITWLKKLETKTVPEYYNIRDFADCILDIFQEIQDVVELEVEYKSEDFNSISIKEVFDI